MYGKIIDGKLVSAPNPMISGNYKIYNPKPEHYKAEGHLEVIETEYPEVAEGEVKYYEKHYVERNGKIYGEWVEAEAPDVPEHIPTAEERITVLEGEVDDLGEALDMILEGVTE